MKPFSLKIVTPDGILFSGSVLSLTARTDEGEVQILAGHADYLAALGIGRAKIKLEDGTERLASSQGGFLSVISGEVTLVAVTFEYKEDIDLERAKAAKEKAETMLASAKDARDERIARAKLNRAISRIKVGSGQ